MKKPIKIVAISDTHSQHDLVEIPECDLLIHSGDFVMSHDREQMYYADATFNFCEWFKSQTQAKRKVAVAGNHDFICQEYEEQVREWLGPDADYLVDESVEIEGWNIYGTPWQPNFHSWAFNVSGDAHMRRKLDLIPKDTDILVTHHPPYGILDKSSWGVTCGCPLTLHYIKNKLNVKIHIFGHIHPGYGLLEKGDTLFCNATIVNEKYKVTNEPIILDLQSAQPQSS